MISGERAVGVLLALSVVGTGALYVQIPVVDDADMSTLSLDDEGSVARFTGTALEVRDIEGGVSFRLLGRGSVRVVSWSDVNVEPGDAVSVVGRVDEYRGEAEVVSESVSVTDRFDDLVPREPSSASPGDRVSVNGTVSRRGGDWVLTEQGLLLDGVDAGPGDVLEVDGVMVDPGLPKVAAVESEVTGVDPEYLFESVEEVKRAVYAGRRGRVELTGVVGSYRFDWLTYLYDDSTGGVDERHIADVLSNEIPLRFPRDYVGYVPEPLERVWLKGRLDSYRGNPQVEVEGVEVIGEEGTQMVEGVVDDVDGRFVEVGGRRFVASPGVSLEEGDGVAQRVLDGTLHSGERVRVLVG
ncbi:MAG: hypothetical protein MAG715_00109 [Methanonatronarchaeales archaeon]|nr:hypothetical protein [Methanonatronarchaeales archaeon]